MLRNIKFFSFLEGISYKFKNLHNQHKYFNLFSSENNSGDPPKPSKLNNSKLNISNADFLKMELSENPEFDKAFPSLKNYKKPSTLFRKDEELDFIESLKF